MRMSADEYTGKMRQIHGKFNQKTSEDPNTNRKERKKREQKV
jgi:hypothetical protein